MARLKKDHSGYRSSGLYKKWQGLPVEDKPIKAKKKKDTTRWCKGRVGDEHDLYKQFVQLWINGETITCNYTETKCRNCNKRLHRSKGVPLRLRIEQKGSVNPIPVKINGSLQKLSSDWFIFEKCWCGAYHEGDFKESLKWQRIMR